MANKITQNIKVPELNKNGKEAVLHLYTTKGNRGLYSHASVQFIDGGFMTHMMFSDFSKTVGTSDARATQKALNDLHSKSFSASAIIDIKTAALAHYGLPTQ